MDATVTQSEAHVASSKSLRAGRIVSALPVLFLLFDSVIKLMKIAPVVESFDRLGYPESLARGIGLLQLACLVVYLIPRTAVLGAILLTGLLGGAISTHLRVGDPFSATRSSRSMSACRSGWVCSCARPGRAPSFRRGNERPASPGTTCIFRAMSVC